MSWWKTIIIGFCIYWGISLISFLLFIQLGLGYNLPNIANTLAEILAFPAGTGKSYNVFLSMLFWTLVFAVIIKVVYFYIHMNRN
jgi:hypothetical protein